MGLPLIGAHLLIKTLERAAKNEAMPLTRAPLSGVATRKGGNGIKDQWCGANPEKYLTDEISPYWGSAAPPPGHSLFGASMLRRPCGESFSPTPH